MICFVLSATKEPVEDMLCSNNRFIFFKLRNLISRDSFLIATSSLANACKAYGVEVSKGSLSHAYLQGCDSLTQILDRLHGTVMWNELEPYIDFFAETGPAELQFRKHGRTLQEWKQEQPLCKEWAARAGEVCDFKKETIEYLDGDAKCLVGLVSKMGQHMFEAYKADIRQQSSIGGA